LCGGAQAQTPPVQAPAPQAQPVATAVDAAPAALPGMTPSEALLAQAAYWRALAPDQAIVSLDRVLKTDPDDASALVMRVQIEIDRDDPAAARSFLQHLRQAHPDDARIAGLDEALHNGPVDPALLAEARRLGATGKLPDAIATYQRAFKGDVPPATYAAEYYQALGGVPGRVAEASAGLAALLTKNPQDLPLQLAYAKIMSYDEASRPDAVDRLQALSKFPAIANEVRIAWRNALLWQGAEYRAQAQLEAYLSQYPSDPELDAKRADYKGSLPDDGARDRMAAYQAMEAKNIPEAEKQFQAALTFNPNDADSMIMMAVIRKQQNRLAEAKTLADAAMALAPDRHDDFVAAMGGNAPASGGAGANGDGGAVVRGEYLRVTRLTNSGNYAAAEVALRRLMRGKVPAGSYVQLGNIQLRAGHLADAEASFRRALKLSPHDVAGLRGLAELYARQGNDTAADALYAQIGDSSARRAIAQVQSNRLRTQASAATDPAEKERLLRAALAADPADPWSKLELARVLVAQRRPAEARAIMADVATGSRPGPDQVQAALIWADEHNDLSRAGRLVELTPPKDRTPLMADLERRASVATQIREAMGVPDRAVARRLLLAVAAQPDPTGAGGAAVADAFLRLRDKPAARSAIMAAYRATPQPTPVQCLLYTNALINAGDDDSARRLIRQVDPQRLPQEQRTAYLGLVNGLAIQQSDTLNLEGKRADAYAALAPRLRAEPQEPSLNLALGRLYQSNQQPGAALRISEVALQHAPNDLDVRRGAVQAAVAAKDLSRADQLVAEAMQSAPDDPRSYLMVADIARARGEDRQALIALRKARSLRQQQLNEARLNDFSVSQ